MAKRKAIEKQVTVEAITEERTITHFLTTDYLDYAIYCNESRGIPSMIDGLKLGARKILHAALTGSMKSGKEVKMPNLIGETMNLSLYHHGPTSLEKTIITLGSQHKDNLNAIQINGQGGHLRDYSHGAPRYLYVELSKYAKLYQVDTELIEHIFDEGQWIEPRFYLPIIPTVLTANTTGIGVGYAFTSMSYHPIDIIDACMEILKGTESDITIRPYVRGIREKNWHHVRDRWESHGELQVIDLNKGILDVTDLHHDMTFEQFEAHLDWMIDDNQIKTYQNLGEGDRIQYRLFYESGELKRRMELGFPDHPFHQLHMYSRVEKDNLTVFNEIGKLVRFESPLELIREFVKYRLTKFEERKTKLIAKLENKIDTNNDLIRFIDAVVNDRLIINKRSIDDIKYDLDHMNISYRGLELSIRKLTKEEIEKLQKEITDLMAELEYVRTTPSIDMYIKELTQLRNDLIADFTN